MKGVHTTSQPGVIYHLYIDMPEGPIKHDVVRHVGSLNFFGATARHAGNELSEDFAKRSFDITALVRILDSDELLTADTTLTIIRYQEIEVHSDPSVESVEIIIQ